jgi:hypothetical protein
MVSYNLFLTQNIDVFEDIEITFGNICVLKRNLTTNILELFRINTKSNNARVSFKQAEKVG